MKQMQNFRARLSTTNKTHNTHERCLTALTRLSPDQVISSATFEPWFVWSTEESAGAR